MCCWPFGRKKVRFVKYPKIFYIIPFLRNFSKITWFTVNPLIFHPRDADPYNEEWSKIVKHELVHFEQQRYGSRIWWVLRYIFSQKFRWNMEKWAYLEDWKNDRFLCCINELVDKIIKIHRLSYKMRKSMIIWFLKQIAIHCIKLTESVKKCQ